MHNNANYAFRGLMPLVIRSVISLVLMNDEGGVDSPAEFLGWRHHEQRRKSDPARPEGSAPDRTHENSGSQMQSWSILGGLIMRWFYPPYLTAGRRTRQG